MTKEDYKTFITQMIADYSSCRGVIAKLRSAKRRSPIILCMSSFRNRGEFVPNQCILWDNDRSLYRGSIKRKRLFNIINKYNICCVEITTAEESERGEAPHICFGNRCDCVCDRCKCRDDTYYESVVSKYPFLNGSDSEEVEVDNNLKDILIKARERIKEGIKSKAKSTVKQI